MHDATKRPVNDRLVDAAFELFAERGYDHTTVDDIAERATVSRTTFFRYYRSKDDVIFPAHDELIAAVQQRLATSSDSTAIVAVADAVRLVLLHYIEEGDRARLRYALTSKVAALRDREIASAARYQRLFREFIANWMGPSASSALRAELMAAAVVAAHNHVLRRWLRGDATEPVAEIDQAMTQVVDLFSPAVNAGDGGGTTVVVFRTPGHVDDVASSVRRAIETL
jgi:AcrR family transcriptional regulator